MIARREIRVVILCLFGCGLVSAFIVPPCQTPDEGFSFLRATHVADGHFRPETVRGWGGGRFSPGTMKVFEATIRMVDHPKEKLTIAEWRELAALAWDGERREVPYPTAAPYSSVSFLPQAAGIRIARGLGFGPLGAFYGGRIANLLFGTLLAAAALALAPVGRRFFALVAFLPMTIHLFGSYAPEVGLIGAALIVPAACLRLALAEKPAGWVELAAIALSTAWIAATKPPYLPIAAFILMVPSARFGGQLRRAAMVAAIFALGAAIGFASVAEGTNHFPDPNDLFGHMSSVRLQTEHLKQHPEQFLANFVSGFFARGVPTYFRLFNLGWLDTPIDPLAVVPYSIVLLMLARAGRADAGMVAGWPAALVVLGGLFLTSLSLYVWCAPIGSDVVALHGRYLLPLAPAAVFLAPASVVSPNRQRLLFQWAAGLMSLVSFQTVLIRYWLDAPLFPFQSLVVIVPAITIGLAFNRFHLLKSRISSIASSQFPRKRTARSST